MKNIEEKTCYIQQYDLTIKTYLTYAQIQNIIETVMKSSTWAERQTIIDEMTLCYVADMSIEEVENIGIDKLKKSGLFNMLENYVENYYEIKEGLTYHESVGKAILDLSKNLPQIKEVITNELQKR